MNEYAFFFAKLGKVTDLRVFILLHSASQFDKFSGHSVWRNIKKNRSNIRLFYISTWNCFVHKFSLTHWITELLTRDLVASRTASTLSTDPLKPARLNTPGLHHDFHIRLLFGAPFLPRGRGMSEMLERHPVLEPIYLVGALLHVHSPWRISLPWLPSCY